MKPTFLALLLPLTSLAHGNIPDIPPDAPGAEYRAVIEQRRLTFADDGLDPVLRMGERNLAWLDYLNQGREPKISFTSKATQTGIPIDRPSEYNPTLILAGFAHLKEILPAEMAKVIFDGAPFTKEPPLQLEDYIDWGRALDRSYQIAARWRTMAPWLPLLEIRRGQDIRLSAADRPLPSFGYGGCARLRPAHWTAAAHRRLCRSGGSECRRVCARRACCRAPP